MCPDEEVGPTPPREPRRGEQEQDEQQQTQAQDEAEAEAGEGGPAAKRPCRRDDGHRPGPMAEQEEEGGEM